MKDNGIETIHYEGRRWEIVDSAAKRYGVPVKVIQEHLGKELFRAEDPRTGVLMICGALPDKMLGCERESQMPCMPKAMKILRAVGWALLLVGLFVLFCVDRNAGIGVLVVSLIIQIAVACTNEIMHPQVTNEKKKSSYDLISFWTVLEYLIECPTNRVAPNLLWLALWGTVVILTINYVDVMAGVVLAIVMGIVKFIYAIKWEKEHPQEIKPVVYVDDGCCGGDGFFDEVSTRRREDLQFLLGIGKYSKKNW